VVLSGTQELYKDKDKQLPEVCMCQILQEEKAQFPEDQIH